MGDTESCDSRAFEPLSTQSRKRRHKVEVYHEIVRKLRELNNEEASQPGFEDELWAHFNRLPSRYAADVIVDRAEDVLMHKSLLHRAYDPTIGPAFELVRIIVPPPDLSSGDSVHSKSITKLDPQTSDCPPRQSSLPPFAFGLSPNLELALEANKSNGRVGGDGKLPYFRHLYEITISTIDKPKILSRLTSLLSEIGLNIQEAHAFSTSDGYSLDVFVVEDQSHEEMEQLRNVLEKNLSRSKNHFKSPAEELRQTGSELNRGHVKIPTDGIDVWEIDHMLLKFDHVIASGPCKELYIGTYGGQDVAIKVLKAEYLNADVQREFFQEVYIFRRVRHKNVVQFIGACTKPPNLCIVTEYMSHGSVYDFMHKHKGIFKLPALLKVAIDVSRGMNYLHQNNIVHRDLKAANLLMDENEVVKVADFGVAKVQTSGVMTSETGTYRWMAPEVIEHKPYDRKADVFSFGIVLWELLTGKVLQYNVGLKCIGRFRTHLCSDLCIRIPYEHLTPLQAAVGVVQKGLRPLIPTNTHPMMVELLESCWQQDPYSRPEFSEILEILLHMVHEVTEEEKAVKRRCYVGETSIKQENEVNG